MNLKIIAMFKINSLLTLFLFVILISTIVCKPTNIIKGHGNIITEERKINGFSKIEVLGSINVEIILGNTYKIYVSDYENLIPFLTTKKQGKKLKITYEGSIRESRGKVKIVMPQLQEIKSIGSGDINVKGRISGRDKFEIFSLGSGDITINGEIVGFKSIDISLKGSGDLSLSAQVQDIDVNYSVLGSGDGELRFFGNIKNIKVNSLGSGDINFIGDSADKAKIVILGSGDVNFKEIKINEVKAKILGSGDCYFNVVNFLEADILGSGNIHIKGKAEEMILKTNNSGSVKYQ